MDINSTYGASGASLVESLYGGTSNKTESQEENNRVSSWGADSVSISPAAKERFAESLNLAGQNEENSGQEQNGEGTGTAAGSGGGGGSSNSNDAKIQSLKSKLSALQGSMGRAGDSEAASISAQISQVMSEISALESGAA